jgi:hypothetical protein
MGISKDKLIADPAAPVDGDSVLSYLRDGTGAALSSTAGALNVQVANSSIVVTGTVAVSSVAGTVAVTQSGVFTTARTWTLASGTDSVTAVLSSTKLEDAASVSGDAGQFILAVRNDAGGSLVNADGDYAGLQVDANGALRVSGSFSINGQYAEDAAANNGDVGIYNLAVRADTPVIGTSANGDYAAQTVDAYNRGWVNSGANISLSSATSSVTTTSGLLAAATAGRRYAIIQNLGSKAIYIGPSGVSTANGIKLNAGGSIDNLQVGPGIAIHAVAESGTQDVRFMQIA